jgi:DNA repair protein RadC
VLFHTHPSGDPTPSDADLLFTRRMAYAATRSGALLFAMSSRSWFLSSGPPLF